MSKLLQGLCVCAVLIIGGGDSNAGQVRISFLGDGPLLQETLAAVRPLSGTSESLSSFRKAVEYYNSATNSILARFARDQNGFYHFDSMTELVGALPFRLCDAPHETDLNCFDAVFLLTTGQFHSDLSVDQAAGPFLVNCIKTNGNPFVTAAATPRDAFVASFGTWYLEHTAQFFGPQMLEQRACVTAAIVGHTPISSETSEANLREAVLQALQARWRKGEIKFPHHVEIVLGHLVNSSGHMVLTDHSGALFHTGNSYTYLEKAGARGPFVRLDFDDKPDLLTWLAAYMRGAEKAGYTHFFATFNGTEIRPIPVLRKEERS